MESLTSLPKFSTAICLSNSMEGGPFLDLALLPALSSCSCPCGSCTIRRVSEWERDKPSGGGVSRLLEESFPGEGIEVTVSSINSTAGDGQWVSGFSFRTNLMRRRCGVEWGRWDLLGDRRPGLTGKGWLERVHHEGVCWEVARKLVVFYSFFTS